jgi:hypothetical protein
MAFLFNLDIKSQTIYFPFVILHNVFYSKCITISSPVGVSLNVSLYSLNTKLSPEILSGNGGETMK